MSGEAQINGTFKNVLGIVFCPIKYGHKWVSYLGIERYHYCGQSSKGKLTDQQKSILEGIYRETIWIGKTFLGQNKSSPKDSSSKVP